MKNNLSKIAIVVGIIFLGAGFWWFEKTQPEKVEDPVEKVEIPQEEIAKPAVSPVTVETPSTKETDEALPQTEEKKVAKTNEPEKSQPKEVPFTTQAPLGKWDALHEEACEEASLVMLKYYEENKKLTPAIAEKEIQTLVAYEKRKYGHFEDSSAAETAAIGKEFYGMKDLQVVYDFSKEDLKKQLAQGKPIIVPAAGRMLKNPNFKQPGPLYHNLVLVGLEGKKIITNDPGTKKGQNYLYDEDVLYGAIHDFSGDVKNIEGGRKAMIIIK